MLINISNFSFISPFYVPTNWWICSGLISWMCDPGSCPEPHMRRDSMLVLILNCCHLGILNTFEQRAPYSAVGSANYIASPDLSYLGFPEGSVVNNPPANAGDTGSVLGLGRCPGKGNGNPLQYSCLGSPMDRGAWRATKSLTWLSDQTTQNNKIC